MSNSSSERLFVANYRNLILLENPSATVTDENKEQINEQIYGLHREFGDYMNIVRQKTSIDEFETQHDIEAAMAGQPDRSIVIPFTGDGSLRGIVPAILGNGAILLKPEAGFADNTGRSSHPKKFRSDLFKIIQNAYITRTRAIACTITDKDGTVKSDSRSLDVVGVGLSGIWSAASNEDEHRKSRISLPTKNKQLKYDIDTLFPVLLDSDSFRIVRLFEENGQERRGDIQSYHELTFANIGHVAMGHIKGLHMSDPKLVEIGRTYGNSRMVKRASIFWLGAKLLTTGLSGNDIPDGQELRFEVLDETKSQESGEASNVEPGDRFHIRRTNEEVLVATTRRNP